MSYEVYRGDNKTLRVLITDSAGVAVDTTGWTIRFTLRKAAADAAALIEKSSAASGEIDAVSEVGGVWDVKLLPADTSQAVGSYDFDIEATTDDATPKKHTVAKSTLSVLQDVTRA